MSRDSLATENLSNAVGWKSFGVAAALYSLCAALATWPRVLSFRSGLPCLGDTLQHLWVMRWYKTCLVEGRSPVLCPEIQFPTGAPLGCFSPLHLQSLIFIPLSFALDNDVLCYNIIWLLGIVFTGLATFLLIGQTVRDPWCAGFGGMLAMLSGPMMLHAIGHLELIYLGGFPLFLWAWMKFVDEPSGRRLAASVALYLLLAMIASYYVVFAIFPAALYVLWRMSGQGCTGFWPWLRARAAWVAAFTVVVLPGLLVEFGNTLWAVNRGYVINRPVSEFRIHSAPLWSYVLPTPYHALGRHLPSNPYADLTLGPLVGECGSYVGVVTLGLVFYALVRRVRFARASYWWLALVMFMVLAWGNTWTVGGHEFASPSLWLKQHGFVFRLIRVPARFNLFAAVVAALVAANGLRHLLARIERRWVRAATFGGLVAAAMVDLSVAPAFVTAIPPMPGCYAYMKRVDPNAAFVEIPQSTSGGSYLYAICEYWQSLHRGRTNASYSGQSNAVYDNRLSWNSPFAASRLSEPDYLANPAHERFELVGDARFTDYAWLYLTAHGFRFAVVHEWPGSSPPPVRLERLRSALAAAKVYEQDGTVVYDCARLPLPTRPVVLTTLGWRPAWDGKMMRVANREARLVVFTPDAHDPLEIQFDARAFKQARRVRLVDHGRELARWDVSPGGFQDYVTPTFRLSAGVHELVLESDGDVRPRTALEASLVGDRSPYSLKVGAIAIHGRP